MNKPNPWSRNHSSRSGWFNDRGGISRCASRRALERRKETMRHRMATHSLARVNRLEISVGEPAAVHIQRVTGNEAGLLAQQEGHGVGHVCLLYTSDAADDLLCVDLGGR